MKTYERAPSPDVRKFLGLPARRQHFDTVVSSSAECVDPTTGRLVFRLVKRAISTSACNAARRAYRDIDELEPPSLSRRAAAGFLDVSAFSRLRSDIADIVPVSPTSGRLRLADGRILRQVVSNPVHSYLAGFSFSRFGSRNTLGRLTRRYPERWESSQRFFQEVDSVLAAQLPDVYSQHEARIALHPHWRIPNTALSTVTINVNYESRFHFDSGDFRDGYSTLSVIEEGDYTGGLLVFPAYRIAVDVRERDVLLCQSHVDLHGNTPVRRSRVSAKRISFVTYLKHKLAQGANRMEVPMVDENEGAE